MDDGGITVEPAGDGPHRPDDPPPRRRTGRIAALAAPVLLLGTIAVVVTRSGDPAGPPAPPSPSMPASPTRADGLPDPGTAPGLSGDPIPAARMLIQPDAYADPASPVLALAADGGWRRIDVGQLSPVEDADGNRRPRLGGTELSPDGRHAAFALRDAVEVIDLGTADVERVPVPGANEYVAWLGAGLIVVGSGGTVLIGADRVVREVGYDGRDVVLPAAEGDLTILSADNRYRPRVNGRLLGGEITNVSFTGPGHREGALIARTVLVAEGSVADPAGPPARRLLIADTAAGTARLVGPATVPAGPVLGWLDAATVLVVGPEGGILKVDAGTGGVTEMTGAPRNWVYALPGGRLHTR